jgi:two-component system chemotaxis response regulator CheB
VQARTFWSVRSQSIVPVTARPQRVIAVAASAGGVEALQELVRRLPADLDAALCVVLHIPSTGRSLLAPILDRVSRLSVVLAEHGAPLVAGTVYVAPADCHLLVRADRIELSSGPKENGVRPAADPMFRSLARSWGPAAVAVVLSGALDDGAAGAAEVKAAGGHVLVQAPEDARVPSMPLSALQLVAADGILSARALGTRVAALTREAPLSAVPGEGFGSAEAASEHIEQEGEQTAFTCPECGGVLWKKEPGDGTVLRCRVGHSYSEASYLDGQAEAIENALWSAIRALEERADFLRRVGERLRLRGSTTGAEGYARRSADLIEQGEAIRSLIQRQRLALEEPSAD